MTISPEQAASALSQIDQTTERSRELKGYRNAGPILMMWGVIWAIGYCASGLAPQAHWVWPGLQILGMALMLILQPRQTNAIRWRRVAAPLAIVAFVFVTLQLFHASSPGPYLIYPGLVCGFAYMMLGMWRMRRLAWIGAAMFAASLAGFYLIHQGLTYWMAAVGAIGLILGGYWLRKA
jgi:hypothetical protein